MGWHWEMLYCSSIIIALPKALLLDKVFCCNLEALAHYWIS